MDDETRLFDPNDTHAIFRHFTCEIASLKAVLIELGVSPEVLEKLKACHEAAYDQQQAEIMDRWARENPFKAQLMKVAEGWE